MASSSTAYAGYNFLHTGCLGWAFEDESRIQVGVTRVPFGPGPCLGNFELASQLTRYEHHIDAENPLGTDEIVPMGAYDFAWPAAGRAWMPAVSLAYRIETPGISWLDHVLPYVEYSGILKDGDDFNDSHLLMLGAAWGHRK